MLIIIIILLFELIGSIILYSRYILYYVHYNIIFIVFKPFFIFSKKYFEKCIFIFLFKPVRIKLVYVTNLLISTYINAIYFDIFLIFLFEKFNFFLYIFHLGTYIIKLCYIIVSKINVVLII